MTFASDRKVIQCKANAESVISAVKITLNGEELPMTIELIAEISLLKEKIARLEKERDEAVRNLRGALHGSCIYCRHNVKGRCKASPTLDEMQYGACWEWRGVQDV